MSHLGLKLRITGNVKKNEKVLIWPSAEGQTLISVKLVGFGSHLNEYSLTEVDVLEDLLNFSIECPVSGLI
ncbi:Glutamyl/glutaminyl-tRNA synthetase class Ib [Penicillium soppii]|jgi:hypothetical protein|uniref:Glutamyl/glutaminyl-tRNA synthetase class Ib n=1 Tax=Penicillium soppii TaxID=69789 RepID=UPI002546D5A1|nr:Glutamyl/glutaminyl-tRNA synthetase class Ib [Penicillium soppii]KAJ5860425.1 Glutamyl/glutaminyl-tRNA synthetase class Ib [Penicillium soppii]